MPKKIEYASIPELLAAAFPDLRSQIEAETSWWSPDPVEVEPLVGDIFAPYLARMLEESGSTSSELERAFELIEKMVEDPDFRVRDLAVVSILEALEDDPLVLEKARSIMGSETIKRLPTRKWEDKLPRQT